MPICPQHQTELRLKEGISPKTGKPYKLYSCPTSVGQNQWCSYKEWGKVDLPSSAGSHAVPQNTKSGLEIVLTEIINVNRKLDALHKLIEERTDFICDLISNTAVK